MKTLNQLIEMVEYNGLDPSLLSRVEVGQLLDAARELRTYREGGVTEELLRRNDGYIKVGRGCVIVAATGQCKTPSVVNPENPVNPVSTAA